ncbi:hypothetical protein BDZ88DRAFT_452863 [Geranomyces variabilis]|nr:hypothetical protein BDZ88DRAFT_452863 [Geranomyces variabilis]KAJ3138397.1 hypothetical protein HDU90_001361 [Geranomyces variabilis]
MVVGFGDGACDVCMIIPCIDPGKAAYNALASPYKQELIVIAKAIHSLAVALVLQLWRGQVALAQFLTNTLLPRLLIKESGLGACRDRVVGALGRVYSTKEGPADFGERAHFFKDTGARRSLVAIGPQGSRERADWVAGLEADIQKERTAGRAILLSELLPRLAFGKIGDEAWVTCASSVVKGTDLWESMKTWETSPTDSMTLAERRAYAVQRFPRKAMPTTAVIAANNARVAAIGAPGYSLLPYDKQSYEYTCEMCSEPFLCDDRRRCGDRHEHRHNGEAPSFRRERIVALSFVASTLSMGVGAVAEVSVLIAKDAAFLAEELEFLAVLEHIRTREHPADAEESEPASLAGNAALKSLAQGMTKPGVCFVWSECARAASNERCAVRCLRTSDRRHQHKHGRANVELRTVAGATAIRNFAQFPARYQLALLAESRKADQAVAKILDAAGMGWRDVVLWSSIRATSETLTVTLPLPPSPSPLPSPFSQSPSPSQPPSESLFPPSSSSSCPPPPSPSSRPPKRKRNDYSECYARLDAMQEQYAGPGLLPVETVRQELAKHLPPGQAKTARVGWFKRQNTRQE